MPGASPTQRTDFRDLAFRIAPDRLRAALTSLLHGLRELRHSDDPTALVDEVADVLRARLGPTERGWLLFAAAQAAEPDHLDALAADVARDILGSYREVAA